MLWASSPSGFSSFLTIVNLSLTVEGSSELMNAAPFFHCLTGEALFQVYTKECEHAHAHIFFILSLQVNLWNFSPVLQQKNVLH